MHSKLFNVRINGVNTVSVMCVQCNKVHMVGVVGMIDHNHTLQLYDCSVIILSDSNMNKHRQLVYI